jgi:pimeloyl-ACP methyl ester carboxylesterase/membrane protein DedA with SNARE-associated domain
MPRRFPRLRWLIAAYLLLLAASHAVRRVAEDPPRREELPSLELPALGARAARADPVRLAYRTWGTPTDPPILLLHGSPGSSRDFQTLGPAIGGELYAVAPDLPGFGESSRKAPDYSIRAHSRYAEGLLDELGIERAHLLGFSMGGGVALELADRSPQRIRSLTLLSSLGVQELELLGSHHMNHALHGAQLALLWGLNEGFPHFGALDGGMLSIPYARNFYDSDQRPLRRILRSVEAPSLVLHGSDDFLVPPAAARESHRLLAQSELVMLNGDHFMIFGEGDRLAGPILDFARRVEQGEAKSRSEATAERRARAAEPFDPSSAPKVGALALLAVMALLAIATLVSEDFACIAAGVLVARGRIAFLPATIACFGGILIGDLAVFWAGRLLGRRFLHRAPLRWFLSPAKVAISSRWFARRGPTVILFSRFLPGTRLPTYFAAGLLHTRFSRFFGYFLLAVALWTPALVYLASLLGSQLFRWLEHLERWVAVGVPVVVVLVWLLLQGAEMLATHRGRRLLVGWWKRKVHWEFWPPWAFYPPLILWYLWLALRHRSLTLFTAANPAIPAGGFIGESKAAILERLPTEAVARFDRIEGTTTAAAKIKAVAAFRSRHHFDLPVVLKPDVGQRGTSVTIARTEAQIEEYCRAADFDFLVQAYIPGLEFGVFWAHLPGDRQGRIFSITEKRMPMVLGDGRSRLEDLVLADSRAVALAPLYLSLLGPEIERVPAAGEPVQLSELGTHCRGAIFVDGAPHAGPALTRRIEEISAGFEGFWFGRYDVRAGSIEEFRAGRFRVIELNGVTSEATHLYDRRNSLRQAYRILFDQWRLAFEIGRHNRERGARPTPLRTLVRELLRYRRMARSRD